MIPKNTKAILSEFRASRGQSEEHQKETPTPPSRNRREPNSPYEIFLRKYSHLEDTIDDFSTKDLIYYFREVAKENGYRYTISNIKKDISIMKRVKSNYSNREICGMIEFLYESDQDYLDKERLTPNLLGSSWVNTIYADMKLWVEDKYIPRSVKQNKSKHSSKGEWKSTPNAKTEIGLGFE